MENKKDFDINVHIRWMIRRDMTEVLEIEKNSFEFPWSEEDFIRCLRQRNCIGMVAEYDERVVGFMIYELSGNRINVLNFVSHPQFRNQGIGCAMASRLRGKLSHRRTQLQIKIRESNLHGQLFFRNRGFKAIAVVPSSYLETDEGAYLMRLMYRPE
jgi:ribosomal-protein-alanine N-acetyltransferase